MESSPIARLSSAALGLGGVADRPTRLDVSSLIRTKLDAASVTDAVNAASCDIEAMSDLHASAAYRRRVAGVLCLRALEQAHVEASAKPAKAAR